MNTILRNSFSVFRRFKTATTLNVLGLSVAFAAFMIIMMQVDYDRGFDRSHPNANRIFRADLVQGDRTLPIHARALVDAILASSPHIEAGTLLNPYVGQKYITVGEGEEKLGFREPFVTCYPEITRTFGFSFVEGEAGCLYDPEKVIIPQSMAGRLFGDRPAVGRTILAGEYIWTKPEPKTLVVGGVYRDFPGNTQLNNAIYTVIDRTMEGEWASSNFICYLLLDNRDAAADLEAEINARFDFSPVWNPNHLELSIRLTPLTGIYLSESGGETFGGVFKTGNAATVRILFFVALLIILIAGINFTNFSIAMAPARVKSINTRKILGSSTGALRGGLISEALSVTVVSWAAATGLVCLLDNYGFLSFMEAGMNPSDHLPLVGLTGAMALATGLAAGLYPAYYTTSFEPAMALKGNFVFSSSGRTLRLALIGFQYVISIGLIITAGFVQLQNRYMQDYDRGFEKDRIAIVELNSGIYQKSKEAYVNRLKEYPGIEDVAFARQKLGAADGYTTYVLTYGEQTFYSYVLEVSPNFMQVMGIPILEGRDFLPSDERSVNELTYIFNRPLQKELMMEPGDPVEMTSWGDAPGRTAGIAGDVKFTSLRLEADYLSFMVNPGQKMLPVSFIRLKGGINLAEAVAHIRGVLTEIDPVYPFDIEFYDALTDRLYEKEIYLSRAITLLSLQAIVISVIGVFGLVLFETQRRRKEIGIRRVHGATLGEILGMFNRVYFRIVCICFVLSAPVAWYAVSRWLENFAYRTPLYWWVFAAAFTIAGAVTLGAVTIQSLQAANANPVESLRDN
jgi:putative ABC transport system permease protein